MAEEIEQNCPVCNGDGMHPNPTKEDYNDHVASNGPQGPVVCPQCFGTNVPDYWDDYDRRHGIK